MGEFEGLTPSTRKITIKEFHIFRLSGGKIGEQCGCRMFRDDPRAGFRVVCGLHFNYSSVDRSALAVARRRLGVGV
jgi:hypothetical protein